MLPKVEMTEDTFNPTLVRLRRVDADAACVAVVAFNPTLVRLRRRGVLGEC